MKYGIPIYRQCAHCGHAIEIRPLVDGSHTNSKMWSDGYVQSLMMPEQAILAKCDHCTKVVWLTDLAPLEKPEAELITGYQHLSAEDYLDLLALPLPEETERTVLLRTMAWQKSNHPRRGSKSPSAHSEAEQKNMLALDVMLNDEWENELVMKIEIARELGDFEKASSLMADVDFSIQIKHLTDQLKQLVEEKDANVAVFQTQDLPETDHTPPN